MRLAPNRSIRFVSVNRRGYGGSTPIPNEEIDALQEGSDEVREAYFRARGMEFAGFVEAFVEAGRIPPVTETPDDKDQEGGIVLLPWSAGHALVVSSLANISHLSPAAQAMFARYVRAVIMLGPSDSVDVQ